MISTHILDLVAGKPASGVIVALWRVDDDDRTKIAGGVTDSDGRIGNVDSKKKLASGTYELVFETGAYFTRKGLKSFHPHVTITFNVKASEHYHVPLLLSPYGYSTYRGS